MTTLVSILFITMIPIYYKITNFSVCLLFLRERDHQNYLLTCTQLIISRKFVSQYILYSFIFSPLHNIINREKHEKHLYSQSSHYGKYRMADHQSACPSYCYKSGYVALTWCFTKLRFTSSSFNVWLTFKAKNNIRKCPC